MAAIDKRVLDILNKRERTSSHGFAVKFEQAKIYWGMGHKAPLLDTVTSLFAVVIHFHRSGMANYLNQAGDAPLDLELMTAKLVEAINKSDKHQLMSQAYTLAAMASGVMSAYPKLQLSADMFAYLESGQNAAGQKASGYFGVAGRGGFVGHSQP